MVAGKLPAVPRYRQKVRFVPLQLGRPLWVDDPHFNLGYHLRHTALASPGGDRELRNLVGRVMSQQLDRHKPLWEMWMVDGLEHGHWALRVEGAPLHGRRRVGHRPADGRARLGARAGARRCPTMWHADPEPSDARARRRRAGRARRESVRAAPRLALRHACAAPGSRAAQRGRAWTTRLDRGRAADAGVVDQRPDRSAPPLGLGAHHARRREDDTRHASAGRSTTSCSRCSPAGSATCCCRATRTSTDASCARSCRCRCARPASGARTTTACRR